MPNIPNTQAILRLAVILLPLLVALLTPLLPFATNQFPSDWNLGLRGQIDALQSWLISNRDRHPLFVYGFQPLSALIDSTVRALEAGLLATPWVLLVALSGLAGLALRGWRAGLLATAGLLLVALFGLWQPTIQTLALMAVAISGTLVLGIPLGVLCALSNRTNRLLHPLLDAMQTLPAFVYLIPVLLVFGIARVPAVVATLIYALPPVIRLTNLGIRQVPTATVEAAQAFGASRWQLLTGVQLPLALPTIMLGVSQTIMLALGLVVIAAMVGAGGLGREVLVGLQRLQIGQALEAGLAIVLLAMLLDRLGAALPGLAAGWRQQALRPEDHETRDTRHENIPLRTLRLSAVSCLILLALASLFIPELRSVPDTWRLSIREPADGALAWMRDNLFFITGPLSDGMTIYLLNPLRGLLRDTFGWPVVIAAFVALALLTAGWRLAVFSALALLMLGLLGMWPQSMDTLSQVLLAASLTVALAVPLGVLAAQSARLYRLLRPVLDFLQTVPTFVYLVPVIMLFNVGRVAGVVAALLYALAPGIRLTELGIRQVPAETIEAATACGSSRRQLLFNVQLPLALPAIMLGINQVLLLVLAMVCIAGLVGGGGLGLEAITGLTRNETGRGIEAGLAIVLLAMLLDRITQNLTRS